MVTQSLTLVSPFSRAHPVLSPGAVLVAKLLALAWCVTGHLTIYPVVRHPPLFFLQPLQGALLWPAALTFLAVLGCVCIWISTWTRWGALCLSGSYFLALGSDLAVYSNNRLFTAMLLLLLGLIRRPEQQCWLRWQCAVVFFGAAFDKALGWDWWSGQFLHSLVAELANYGLLWSPGGHSGGRHVVAEILAQGAGRPVFAVVSWGVIGVECALAWGYLRNRSWVVPVNAAFFVGLIVLTGSPMGMFAYAGVVVSLLLVQGIGEGERLGDSVAYWSGWGLLLGSPLFSTWLVLVSVVGISLTFRRERATSRK